MRVGDTHLGTQNGLSPLPEPRYAAGSFSVSTASHRKLEPEKEKRPSGRSRRNEEHLTNGKHGR